MLLFSYCAHRTRRFCQPEAPKPSNYFSTTSACMLQLRNSTGRQNFGNNIFKLVWGNDDTEAIPEPPTNPVPEVVRIGRDLRCGYLPSQFFVPLPSEPVTGKVGSFDVFILPLTCDTFFPLPAKTVCSHVVHDAASAVPKAALMHLDYTPLAPYILFVPVSPLKPCRTSKRDRPLGKLSKSQQPST